MAVVLGTSSGFVSVAPTADPNGSNTTIDGSSVVTKHTSPQGAVKITSIGWYRGSGTNAANFEVALYADSAGAAGARLFVDNTNTSTAAGWITTAVDWAISENTAYWLGLQMDAHTGSSTVDTETTGGAGSDVLTSQTTLNDPYGGGAVGQAAGMYAIYALVTFQFAGTPGVGELTLTGQAPTVTVSNNKNVTPDVGALTGSGYAPTWSSEAAGSSFSGTPATGEITLSGYTPTVETPRNISTLTGEISVTGYAPTVQTPVNVTTSTGEITATGYSPTIQTPRNITTDVGALVVTGYAPTVQTPLNITSDTGVITLIGHAPSLGSAIEVTPSLGEITANGYAPTVSALVNLYPATGEITATGYSPTVQTPVNLLPATGDITLTGYEPTISAASGVSVLPSTGQITIEGFSPVIFITENKVVTPGTGELTIQGNVPYFVINFAPVSISKDSSVQSSLSKISTLKIGMSANSIFSDGDYDSNIDQSLTSNSIIQDGNV